MNQFQIVQTPTNEILVRIVPKPEWSKEHEAALHLLVRKELGVALRVDLCATLMQQDGGKVQIVVVEAEA